MTITKTVGNMASRPTSPAVSADGDPEKSKPVTTGFETPQLTYDEDDVKRLVRKIDWRIMPFLWGYAVLSAVDVSLSCVNFWCTDASNTVLQKIIVSNAALYGMKDDNHLKGQGYSWGMSTYHSARFQAN